MEEERTQFSEDILRRNAQFDAYCKRILSYRIVLAHIFKDYLPEYADCSLEDICNTYIEDTPERDSLHVIGINTEDTSSEDGKVVYDLLFTARIPHSDERIGLLVNIEAQTKSNPSYPLTKRAFYYCSRLISSQKGKYFTKSAYDDIRKVYSIWILINPKKKSENTVTEYSITERNIIGNVKEPINNYDLMTVMMVCIGNPKVHDFKDSLELLSTFLYKELTNDERLSMLESNFTEVYTVIKEKEEPEMKNLGLGLYESGKEEGRKEGRKEGKEEGELKSLVRAIKNLMESMNITISAAMNLLRIPQSERPKYEALLNTL